MKKTFYLLILLFFGITLQAQVGINTTNPEAQLDIRSSNQATPTNTDGILIPKVDAFPAINPTAAQQGMLVYLTTTSGTDLPGFYYWDNTTTDWIPIGNNNSTNWRLNGNAITGTEFVGSTTNFPLQFRVNNIRSGLLDIQNDNYVLGENALSQATPGTQTIAIGTNAGLNQLSPATGNVFVGHQSGESNTSGLRNTYMGFRAGRVNTTSSNNTIIGFNSGVSNAASGNSFLGFASGFANTTGGLNTFIGSSSGVNNTTANLNTFIGASSGNSNTTGSSNTFLGHQSGVTTTTGGSNTFVGQLSGGTNTTGTSNTAIGTSSNFGSANLTNATAIGALAQVNASNSLVLGSITGVNGATSSVNVGIGTTTPQSSLHLNTTTLSHTQLQLTNATTGSLVSDGLLVASAIAGNGEAGIVNQEDANLYLESGINGAQITLGSNGNIGIGTFDSVTLPLDKLHVQGNIRMVDGTQAAGRVLTSDANGRATWQNASANAWGLTGNNGTNATTNFLGTTDNVDLVFRRSNVLSGRIGTTNTFFGLSSGLVNTGDYNTFIGQGAGSANATGDDNTFIGRLAGANGISGNDNSYLGYAAGLNNTGNSNLILGAFASQNTTGSFNVFVGNQSGGTNTTGSRNTVLGFNAELGAGNLTNATAVGSNSQVDTSNSLVLGSILGVNGATASTNVGIGTTSPLTRLEILDDNNVTSSTARGNLHITATNPQAIDIGASITLGGYNDDAASIMRVFGSIEGRKTNATTTSSSGYLAFKTNNAGTLAERMRITNAGDVGIGTGIPGGQFQLSLDEGRKPGTNTWTIVSDQRLKTINGTYTKGLNEILQLNPIRFNYKNAGERTFEKEVLDTEYPGFIAQEVQPLFPDAVGTDADGFLNFNIHPILIASVNAIKELNAKNESLQTENESLKTELNEQKALLESVLQRLTLLEQK